MILPTARDPRFVTSRRGGTLTDPDHHLLALWAASCAEHVLHLFESAHPEDPRPRQAIDHARAWVRPATAGRWRSVTITSPAKPVLTTLSSYMNTLGSRSGRACQGPRGYREERGRGYARAAGPSQYRRASWKDLRPPVPGRGGGSGPGPAAGWSVIDAATDTVTATVPVGPDPDGVAVDPAARTAYVANGGSGTGTVSVIQMCGCHPQR